MSVRGLLLLTTLPLCLLVIDIAEGGRSAEDVLTRKLQERGIATDTPALLEAIRRHEDPWVRTKATRLLAIREEKGAIEALRVALETDPDNAVRQAAAQMLTQLGQEEGMEALRSRLETSEDRLDRLAAAWYLACAGDPVGYSLVEDAARSERSYERYTAAFYLAYFVPLEPKLGPESRSPAAWLAQLAEDPDPRVRRHTLFQLVAAVRHGASAELLSAAAERLREDPDPQVREAAQVAVNRIAAISEEAPTERPQTVDDQESQDQDRDPAEHEDGGPRGGASR